MRHLLLGGFCGLLLALTGCGDSTGSNNEDAGTALPDCADNPVDVTTAQLFTDVVQPRCAGCHKAGQAGATSGKIELDDVTKLAATVGKASQYAGSGALKIVTPSNPGRSSMMLKVLGGSPTYTGPESQNIGGKMPTTGLLPAAEQEKFRQWICGGAN